MVDPDDSHSHTSTPDLSGKMTLFELASNRNSRERGILQDLRQPQLFTCQ
jgi:hypothetical protein